MPTGQHQREYDEKIENFLGRPNVLKCIFENMCVVMCKIPEYVMYLVISEARTISKHRCNSLECHLYAS